ncbi:Yap3 protein [Saccharomycopsis crataegensis]|uniref:Yap3 protein n=1 Tax=Saccharomycopsis crataegensis TaxID=43959 RepID=A0AAV5QJ98_9ASCO|nr:Yap3 protein [Saccharomycopsis crataegensis]
MNMDQMESIPSNFWDDYLQGNKGTGTGQQELSAANLQSFSTNNGTMFAEQQQQQYPLAQNSDPFSIENLQLSNNHSLGSGSFSASPDHSAANMSQSLNQLISNINETQKEVSIIKEELNKDLFPGDTDIVAAAAASGNNSNVSANIIERNSKEDTRLKGQQMVVDKRKSQNRAAQRAFRERKEQKLKELEKKLEESEAEKKKVFEELEKLKLKNIIITTENQMLIKNKNKPPVNDSIPTPNSSSVYDGDFSAFRQPPQREPVDQKFTFPCVEPNKSLVDTSIKHGSANTEALIYADPDTDGGRLLTMQAVWDYINKFEELNSAHEIDMALVMEALEGTEKCHGLGPAYSLEKLNSALFKQLSN